MTSQSPPPPEKLVREKVGEGHEREEGKYDGRGHDHARDAVAPQARRIEPLEKQLGQQHPRPVNPDPVPATRVPSPATTTSKVNATDQSHPEVAVLFASSWTVK